MKLISIIVPAFNEEANIASMYKTLVQELEPLPYLYEIMFINDGSSDGTLDEILKLANQHETVKYISLSRNFGKESAMFAGMKRIKGDAAILMDSDMQHPPTLICEMIQGYEDGFHQVVAKRSRKGDSKLRSAFSSLYYKVVNSVTDVSFEDGEGDFRLLSRKAINSILSLSESNRFSKGIYSWIGLSKKTISYENVLRAEGDSKWSFSSLVNYGIDGIISFNMKPLRICFYTGFLVLFLSLLYIAFTFYQIMVRGVIAPGYFTTITAILLLGGIQLISLGVIGEYVGRIYNETKQRPHFLVEMSNVDEYDES
ncbi:MULTISPECIES: glycosyltransferase family 2 protein [unclassified Planococcus (in: firmicutes)]|uniref:glycosyltransferase family 2 protein n=1 Tax=Planococcus TaxID=1372 RepID=UPI000C322F71|nr:MULTISPECIES: glycosyltransferase family 2 protein [unclassified Planococcus (in: firmicutes)]AUD14772.1 glycosyltransferase [Planococcus sp. MB-3u-03]PKG45085.1 glycosyltransferase [Planococcus sp. Urea-trap-24]PKG87428.1 glycosyltransferase [Planococcus sp. Urea-3u-39]PKH42553.1 glycosyltransferase [Planococcus sp. MB-3u-09]